MKSVLPLRVAAILFFVFASTRLSAGALENYVRAPDDSFAWQVRDTQQIDGLEITTLALTSQTWRGGRWTHTLYIACPPTLRHPETAFLEITHAAGKKNVPDVKRLGRART